MAHTEDKSATIMRLKAGAAKFKYLYNADSPLHFCSHSNTVIMANYDGLQIKPLD